MWAVDRRVIDWQIIIYLSFFGLLVKINNFLRCLFFPYFLDFDSDALSFRIQKNGHFRFVLKLDV
jgi:hypothetical protein